MRWGAGSWIGILLAVGVVQAGGGQWVDAGVFFSGSAGLLLDLARPPSQIPGASVRGLPAERWVVPGAALVGIAACVVPRHSVQMQLLVCAAGLAAILVAWRRGSGSPSGPWPRGLRRLAGAWSIVLVAGCIWELAQFLIGLRHRDGPAFALSDLLDPILATAPGKAVFVGLWIAGGAYLLRGGRR